MGSSRNMSPEEPSSPGDSSVRKRVCKACDRCRLKKSKCDGSSPCSRCKADNAICVFGERKKSQDKVYPKGYVEMLESQQTQLVAGLQELYRRLQNGDGWVGSPLKESARGVPLTHDILERLGALKSDNKSGIDHFEDNYEILQNMLFANGAPSMPMEHSFETNSEAGQSPTLEMGVHQRMPSYSHSFPGIQFPPTPPVGSPHPLPIKTSSPLKAEMSITTSTIPNQEQWQIDATLDYSGMDYNMTYDSPISDSQIQAMAFAQHLYNNNNNTDAVAINPCLTMKQWPTQDDQLQRYFPNNFT